MKKITDLWFWEGILCDTESEATKICELMNEAGIVRRSNKIVSVEDTHRDDTRWNWITYFPKDWTYWTDNYEWKTRKYTIYPAVLFYLREEVVEKDWYDLAIEEYLSWRWSAITWEMLVKFEAEKVKLKNTIEKYVPKTKQFTREEIRNYISSLSVNEQTYLNWQFLKDFLSVHNLLCDTD